MTALSTLHHVTLHTGNVAITPRWHVPDASVRRVAQVLAGDGYEPTVGVHLRVLTVWPGRAQYRIDLAPGAPRALVLASLCWSPAYSDRHWRETIGADRAPVPTPWLAVSFDYALAPLTMRPADILALGNLERVIAWAIIEGLGPAGAAAG